ncbi:MAG: tail fiber domain-containing protein, partial [Aquirufa sp.]
GDNNSGLGHQALYNNTLGNSNTSLGMYSMHFNISGNNNVGLGFQALQTNTTGSNNVTIGYNSDVASNNLSNSVAIGASATVSSSNTVSIGSSTSTKFVFGIPTTTNAGYALQVGSTTSNGNGAYLTNGGTWTDASSREFKENFEVIDEEELLAKIGKLDIKKWNYKGTDEVHIGPIAEEFKALFELGVKDDNQHISTLDGNGIALKSVQILSKKVGEKDKQIDELKERIRKLESLMESLLESK